MAARKTTKSNRKQVSTPEIADYIMLYSQFFRARPDAVAPGGVGEFRIADRFDYGLRTTTDNGTGKYLNEAM